MTDEDANDRMSEPLQIVRLARARNPIEAQVIVALLRAHEIPCYVPGAQLQDEFATAQKMMGAVAVDVMVPASALEAARRLLAEARAKGGELSSNGHED